MVFGEFEEFEGSTKWKNITVSTNYLSLNLRPIQALLLIIVAKTEIVSRGQQA